MRNSELSMEFSKYVLEHPEMDELLTEEKVVIFLPEFDQGSRTQEFQPKYGKEHRSRGWESPLHKGKTIISQNCFKTHRSGDCHSLICDECLNLSIPLPS